MGDAFKKVRPGDRLVISAGAYNEFLDTSRARKNREHDRGAPGDRKPLRPGVVLVKNISLTTFERHDAIYLDQPAITPTANFEEWNGRVVMWATSPKSAMDDRTITNRRLAVALEPIPRNAIGHAAAWGVVQTRINVTHENHTHVTALPGNSRLQSTGFPGDPAEILWKETGLGEKRATIRLGKHTPTIGDYTGWATGAALQFGKTYVYFWDPGPKDLPIGYFSKVVRPYTRGFGVFPYAGVWRIQYVLQVMSGSAMRTKYELIRKKVDGTEQVIQTAYISHFDGGLTLGGYTTSHPYQVVLLAWHSFDAGDSAFVRCSVTHMYKEPSPYTAFPEYFWPWVTGAVVEGTMVGNQYPTVNSP
jgi:hypothetical protein